MVRRKKVNMNIELEINGESLVLGMSQDQSKLSGAGFKKMGLFSRAFLPIQKMPGDVIFFAKNPTITAFNGDVKAAAILDTSMGADMMNGTSCYAIFNGGRLRYVICQVIQNNITARQFVSDVRQAARVTLGEPTSDSEPQVWQKASATLASDLGRSGSTAFMHWWTG